MICTIYHDVQEFFQLTQQLLLDDEVQNLILLGNLYIGVAGTDKSGWRDPATWLMATVSSADAIHLVAVMTPPHNITLYAVDEATTAEAVNTLVAALVTHELAVPGVTARSALAESFVASYTPRLQLKPELTMQQRIYQLTQVNPAIPEIAAPLSMRMASPKDMAFLPWWLQDFNNTSFLRPLALESEVEVAQRHIENGRLFILEDAGVPVSLAGRSREMRSACGVGPVYTPPYFRGRGYATAAVAHVSRYSLERGFTYCVLYTDATNPISNSIYQRIGYHHIYDSSMYSFVEL